MTDLERFLLSSRFDKHLARTDSAIEIAEAILAEFQVLARKPSEEESNRFTLQTPMTNFNKVRG